MSTHTAVAVAVAVECRRMYVSYVTYQECVEEYDELIDERSESERRRGGSDGGGGGVTTVCCCIRRPVVMHHVRRSCAPLCLMYVYYCYEYVH